MYVWVRGHITWLCGYQIPIEYETWLLICCCCCSTLRSLKQSNTSVKVINNRPFYPMPEISNFQRTNYEFAKSEQKYPVKNHFSIRTLIFPSVQSLSDSVYYHQRDIFRKKTKKIWPVESGDRAVASWGGIKLSDTTYVVYGFPLLRQCHRVISMTSCVLLDRSRDIVATSAQRHRDVMASLRGSRNTLVTVSGVSWAKVVFGLETWGFPGSKTITRAFLFPQKPHSFGFIRLLLTINRRQGSWFSTLYY
jgi:hypothetical protein